MTDYNGYNLSQGSHNESRYSGKTYLVGFGPLNVWAWLAIGGLLGLILSGFIPFGVDIILFCTCYCIFLKFISKRHAQFMRNVFQKKGYKRKSSCVPSRRTFAIAGLLILSPSLLFTEIKQAQANFEIIVPEKPQASASPYDELGDKIIQIQGGFGHEVRLQDFLQQVLPKPYSPLFISPEIRDLRIDWYAPASTDIDYVLADISRRYNVLFVWEKNGGILNVNWLKGECLKPIEESKSQQFKYSQMMGLPTPEPLRMIRQIINKQQHLVKVC